MRGKLCEFVQPLIIIVTPHTHMKTGRRRRSSDLQGERRQVDSDRHRIIWRQRVVRRFPAGIHQGHLLSGLDFDQNRPQNCELTIKIMQAGVIKLTPQRVFYCRVYDECYMMIKIWVV